MVLHYNRLDGEYPTRLRENLLRISLDMHPEHATPDRKGTRVSFINKIGSFSERGKQTMTKYEELTIEVVKFAGVDVICSSQCDNLGENETEFIWQ